MITRHTEIIRGEVQHHSPNRYDVTFRETGEVLGTINIQKGPVNAYDVNGIFIEDLLLICIDQLEHFEDSALSCQENRDALRHLRDALAHTRARQYERTLRGVQGENRV